MQTKHTAAKQGCVSLVVTNRGKGHAPESGEVCQNKYRCTTNTQNDKQEGGREGLKENVGAMKTNLFSKAEAG